MKECEGLRRPDGALIWGTCDRGFTPTALTLGPAGGRNASREGKQDVRTKSAQSSRRSPPLLKCWHEPAFGEAQVTCSPAHRPDALRCGASIFVAAGRGPPAILDLCRTLRVGNRGQFDWSRDRVDAQDGRGSG